MPGEGYFLFPEPLEMDEAPSPLPPQDEYINQLVRATPTPEQDKIICTICLETCSTSNGEIIQLSCNPFHIFHADCLTKWFTSVSAKRNTCPNCRIRLFRANHLTEDQMLEVVEWIASPALALAIRQPRRPPTPIPDEQQYANELVTLTNLISSAVVREAERSRVDRTQGQERWVQMINESLEAFQEQRLPRTRYFPANAYLLLYVSAAYMGEAVFREYPQLCNTPGYRQLDWFANEMERAFFGQEPMMRNRDGSEMRERGGNGPSNDWDNVVFMARERQERRRGRMSGMAVVEESRGGGLVGVLRRRFFRGD